MLDESEARRRILDALEPGGSDSLPLDRACGRFSAGEVRATVAVPAFDNSAMDGYALRAEDVAVAGAVLRLLPGEQAAGRDRGYSVSAGTALRIFTGAPMPSGANAVVMQEDVTVMEGGEAIAIGVEAVPGEFVRRAGSDLCSGQIVLRGGDRLTPAGCGILASQGRESVPVTRLPSITVVTTGGELRRPGPGVVLGPGELFNSNGPMLVALAREICGAGSALRHLHAPDDAAELGAVLGDAVSAGGVVIVSGGVSVGDHDLVKPTLGNLGVKGAFWRVRVKPGKPFYFGSHPGGAHVFGLPGNPVSSFVTFLLFVKPALLRMMGARLVECAPPFEHCRLDPSAPPIANPGDRPHYVRGTLDRETGFFLPRGLQQSHALFGLSQSNALLRLEEGSNLLPGSECRALSF